MENNGNTQENIATDSALDPTTTTPLSDRESTSLPEKVPTDDDVLAELAKLPLLQYERERAAAAERLHITRLAVLDQLVEEKRQELRKAGSNDELITGIKPWEGPVNDEHLAQSLLHALQRYIVLPPGADIAIVLWILGTYCYDYFPIFPKLLLTSPEKRCGKTTTMDLLHALCNRSLPCSSITPAATFRVIEAWHPTLLIDEADAFLNEREELRGIINSGHQKSGAFVLRVEGEGGNRKPMKFSTWAPMAIAMIKLPPGTIVDRSILVTLRRKMPGETTDRLPLELADHFQNRRRMCARWAADNVGRLKASHPDVPMVGNDRAEDNWTPLLAIADCLGGEWPALARQAMIAIEGRTRDEDSLGVMLLEDIKGILAGKQVDRISSGDLVTALLALEERPWGVCNRGGGMSKNFLANLLRPYSIRSKKFREGSATFNGYAVETFEDAFQRYLSNAA